MCKTFFNTLIVAVMWYAGLPRWPLVKNLPAMQDRSLIPGLERSLEKEMATHYSILAWEIPWAEEPDELHSMGVTNKSDMTEVTATTATMWFASPTGFFDWSREKDKKFLVYLFSWRIVWLQAETKYIKFKNFKMKEQFRECRKT